MKETPCARLQRMTMIERLWWDRHILPAGVDEVGRGPLAGPVVAACVVMPPDPLLEQVNDSKKVTPKRREILFEQIAHLSPGIGIGICEVDEIERLNIRGATRLAMVRAIEQCAPQLVLVDAESDLETPVLQESMVRGDQMSYVIAAASIYAKVYRDQWMIELDAHYPMYGFAQNKGYGTGEHIAALRKYGPCPLHRSLFLRKIL